MMAKTLSFSKRQVSLNFETVDKQIITLIAVVVSPQEG